MNFNASLKADKSAFTSLQLLKGQIWSWHLWSDELHFLLLCFKQKHWKRFPNDSNHSLQHLTLRLDLIQMASFSSVYFFHTFKNLIMHSTDDVICGKTKLVLFDQFDNTFSWVDELSVLDKIQEIYGTEDTQKPAVDFHKCLKTIR